MLNATTFLLHTLVVGYLAWMARDFHTEAKANGMLMWRFTFCFTALLLLFFWIWVGYFEELTDFWPGGDLRRLTSRSRAIPYTALLASLIALRRGLRKRNPR